MNKSDYTKEAIATLQELNPIRQKLHELTIAFKEANPTANFNSMPSTELERELDNLMEFAATIKDHVNGTDFNSKKSFRYKIRKALGYTYP